MNSKPIPLEEGYTAEFDTVTKYEWYKIIDQFSDANIYQTWAYDAIRCGEKNISHLVLRAGNKIIAAAQARIVRIPVAGLGAAYVRWGPFWALRDKTPEHNVFRYAVRALRNEYVCRRGLILRIFPILYDDNSHSCLDILKEERYIPVTGEDRGRTLILGIRPPIEELRKQLSQRWRRCLTKAEREHLEVIEGTEDGLFVEFISIYEDMLRRKKFQRPNDINEFRMIQRELPAKYKMNIFLCRSKGVISAGVIYSAIGDTGVYLFGATNEQGMINNASYLTHWRAIQWLKQSGCCYYNLNGINPQKNPGTYVFKEGLVGKRGKDVYYLGRFDCYPGPISGALAHTADLVMPLMKKAIILSRPHNRYKPKKL